MKFMMILLFTIILLLIIAFAWRKSSTKKSLPCPWWLGWMVEIDNPFAKVLHAKTIVHHADIKVGMKVLDAGCGPGRVTIPAARAVGTQGKVTALDLQQEMLQKTQQKVLNSGLFNVEYLQGSLAENKLTSHRFDRILLITVLGEVTQPREALQELYAALNSDGVLSITETVFDPHFQSRNKIRELAISVGFKEIANFGSWYAYTMNFAKNSIRQ